MFDRLRTFASVSVATLALTLACGAMPAFALQADVPAPDVVSGVVLSAQPRVVPETGAIVTDVQVLDTQLDGTTALTDFTMQGGVVGEMGMWSEQYTDLQVGDTVIAPVTANGDENAAASAPISGIGLSSAAVPGVEAGVDGLAAGYIWGGLHWADSALPVTYQINPTGLPAGSTAAINAAAQTWEDDAGSYMDYTYTGTTAELPGHSDDVNVIGAGSLASASTIAQCQYWYFTNTQEIVEFDITFNTAKFSFATNGASNAHDIQSIGTHELGHMLHLADLYDADNSTETMYGYGAQGDTSQRTLEAGDIAGIRAIYPQAISGQTFSGYVTNSSGAALSGVSVQVGGVASGTSNSSGFYNIEGIPAGTYTVTYSLAGYTTQTALVNLSTSTARSVVMAPVVVTSALSGIVTNTSGSPLSGVSVQVGGVASGSTNGSGFYNIEGITAGTYTVTYSLAGYTTQAALVNLATNTSKSITMAAVVVAPKSTLSGYVTNTGGGPLAGASVLVNGVGSGTTNSSGFYSISGIPAGTYSVTYSLAGYTPQTDSVNLATSLAHSVSLAALPVPTSTLSGSVRDASGGGPLAGALIQVGSVANGTTDANGQFAVSGIPAGTYTVTYSMPSYQSAVALTVLTSSRAVDMVLTRMPVTFTGRVIDVNAVPIRGAFVNVGGVASAFTNANGAFAVSGIPVGTHDVAYSFEGYETRTVPLSFTSGANSAGDIVLLRTPPSLSLAAASKTVKKNRSLKFSGTLMPRHFAAAPVRVYKWRWVNKKWKSYSYSTALTTDNGLKTTFAKSLKFAYTGKWRILARHSTDAVHDSDLKSKYLYVTVK